MTPSQYLAQRVAGYANLDDDERLAISEFSLLWAAFEGAVCGTEAKPSVLLQIPVTLQAIGHLDMDPYDAALAHFRNRYFANGEFTHYFDGLHLENGSQLNAERVRAAMSGVNTGLVESLQALLLICHRLRNNLFHGVKMQYGIAGQRENFQHACCILMAVMDRHPPAY
ncbi:hypothetical protein ABIC89_004540 [Variovorax boronicumulans]|uniref:hypothetical protein n=1 Tax=Variovorax boronicumulans TaxID=436515 RepID=UPI0033941E67